METKENEKLLALTKLIGRKDLSFGCILQHKYPHHASFYTLIYNYKKTFGVKPFISAVRFNIQQSCVEIIGHPLLISDILNGLSSKGILRSIIHLSRDGKYIPQLHLGKEKLELDLYFPLFSSQSEEFKEFIYEAFNIK